MSIFDKKIERKNTDSIKYDGLKRYFGVEDAKPLWVADMDFETPDFIIDAISKRLEHRVLGYEELGDEFFNAIIGWYKKRHNFSLEKEEIIFNPGVVAALSACVEAFSAEEDEVIVQSPVYYPFYSVVKEQNRKIVTNPLKRANGRYEMDFEDLKKKISKKTKMLILCSPHNPVGRVWEREELEELVQICKEKEVLIVSDEIHSDIVFKPFTPLGSIFDEIITLNAPSKTFNLAGLNTSYAFSKNRDLLEKLNSVINKRAVGLPGIFGVKSLVAAYSGGEQWLEELLLYLRGNFETVKRALETTKIETKSPEATYLMWLDFSKYGLSQKEIESRLLKEAKLALNNGLTFGKEAKGFFRLNIALAKNELEGSLEKLTTTFK